jgi:hypothetical protein
MNVKTGGYRRSRRIYGTEKLDVSAIADRQKPLRFALDARMAGELDRRFGELLRRHELTAHEFAVLNRMLWTMRSYGSDRCQATYKQICQRTGICKDVVISAISKAISFGIIRKAKSRVRRAIGAFVRWVNGSNTYFFQIPDDAALESEIEAVDRNVSLSALPPTSLKARINNQKSVPIDPKSRFEKALMALAMANGCQGSVVT